MAVDTQPRLIRHPEIQDPDCRALVGPADDWIELDDGTKRGLVLCQVDETWYHLLSPWLIGSLSDNLTVVRRYFGPMWQ